MQDDTLLIYQIQNKDESAFSKLYDDYSASLYGVILRMCNDEQHAQNLLQDTFLTIWEKSHQYDPEKGKFYTWAYRIAKNKTLNFLRQSHNLIQTEDLSVDIIDIVDSYEKQEYLKLDGCITELDQHHQKAIELIYFKGLTHREAHKVMKIPLGTFKSYISQALKKLQLNYDKAVLWILIFIEVIK